jgi:hypothetical protein
MSSHPVPHTVAGTGPPASNTDESRSPVDQSGVFHVKHPEDQSVIGLITRNIIKIRAAASRKAWRVRKRQQAARVKAGGDT